VIGAPSIGGMPIKIVPVQRTPRMGPLKASILTSPDFDRAEFNRWMADFYGYNDHSALKPGQIVRMQMPNLFGPPTPVIMVREDDWQRIQAAAKSTHSQNRSSGE
jgi:hypothetical protein